MVYGSILCAPATSNVRQWLLASVQTRFNDSTCWKAIMKVKEVYMEGRMIKINKGDLARVWHDPWMLNVPLKTVCPVFV